MKKTKILKNFKYEYVVIIILVIVAICVFFSSNITSFSFFESKSDSNENLQVNMEEKLNNLISKIENVGKVNVLINYDGTNEQIILKNTESKIENGVKVETETAVLIGGKPYVIKENSPKVNGVVVVCEGADNLSVKLNIIEVIKTMLNVSSENIKIIKMK